jgi:HEAT repeat protein
VLRDIDGFDAAEAARTKLDGSPIECVRPGWVATLGEVGVAGDAPRVAMLLASHRARVREAALTAMGRLSPGEAVARAAAMLGDTSGRVRRAAVAILVRSPRDECRHSVAKVLQYGTAPARAAAIAVLATWPAWEPMPYLLDGVLDDDELVRLRAWQNIDAWQRRYGTMGWVTPSPECREAIGQRLPSVTDVHHVPDFAAGSWAVLLPRLTAL